MGMKRIPTHFSNLMMMIMMKRTHFAIFLKAIPVSVVEIPRGWITPACTKSVVNIFIFFKIIYFLEFFEVSSLINHLANLEYGWIRMYHDQWRASRTSLDSPRQNSWHHNVQYKACYYIFRNTRTITIYNTMQIQIHQLLYTVCNTRKTTNT